MTRPFVTASAIERVVECPASTVLPQTQSTSHWAKSGHDIHAELEEMVEGRATKTSAGITLEMLQLPGEARAEIAFSYDVVTGEARELGHVEGRDYPPSSFSTVMGTADVVGRSRIAVESIGQEPVESVDIRDWKSTHEPPPPDSWQMRLLAFMAARARGLACARTQITHIKGGINHSRWHVWTEKDFLETERVLRRTYDAVNRLGWKKEITLADVRFGPHCHWCPAFLSCPYPKSLLQGVSDSGQAALLTNRDAAEAYGKWQTLRTLAGRMEDVLKQYASQRPVDLGGGNLWGKPTQASGYRKFKMYSQADE